MHGEEAIEPRIAPDLNFSSPGPRSGTTFLQIRDQKPAPFRLY
jgi:hypothetical protein